MFKRPLWGERAEIVLSKEKLLTAKSAKKVRKGRKEEQTHSFALRSSRIFFAFFAVKGFSRPASCPKCCSWLN
jgi:hypothetical protein